MAYINKYYAGWGGIGIQGYVYIDQLDYSGGATVLKLPANAISVNYSFGDWNDPIIGIQAEVAVLNLDEDFFVLLPLMTAEEMEYRIRIVVIYPTTYTLFEGFINCDTTTQKYLHRQTILLTASSYLYKLEYDHPVSIDTLQNKTFIDLIDEILKYTGSAYNIRVNCKLHAEGDVLLEGQTLFNKNGVYTELFWEDEVTRMSGLDILKKILKTFDCYIYWWRGFWYIERYEDLWTLQSTYVEYVTGTTYSTIQAGTVVSITKTVIDVHSLKHTNQSQNISMIPGLKTIQLKLEDKRVINLAKSAFAGIIDIGTGVPNPNYRTWQKNTIGGGVMQWINTDKPKVDILNSIQRVFSSTTPPDVAALGLATTFKVTVQDETTQLNIRFKYAIDKNENTEWNIGWKEFTFVFEYYLRIKDTNEYIFQTENTWKKTPKPYVGSWWSDTQQSRMFIEASGMNIKTNSIEVSINIPLGEVWTYADDLYTGMLKGDQTLIFGLCCEYIKKEGSNNLYPLNAWYGDFNFTTTGDNQNNLITGKVNSKFLNKKDIDLALYDMDSYNYLNGILRGDSLDIRTERWGTLGGVNNIVDKGVCYSTSHLPTIADSHTNDGTGSPSFSSQISGCIQDTTYYVRAYTIDMLGTVQYGDEKSFKTIRTNVGDPWRGGIIAYIYQVGDPGYIAGEFHGLIAGMVDLYSNDTGGYLDIWGRLSDGGPYTAGAWWDLLTFGLQNSNLMWDGIQTSLHAVKRCMEYQNNGYSSWYLPSADELQKFFLVKDLIGGFSPTWYWSSSEKYGDNPNWKFAHAVSFAPGGGIKTFYKKNNSMRIRPVSYF